jgi:lanthanide-dependent methanol dehydrogenase
LQIASENAAPTGGAGHYFWEAAMCRTVSIISIGVAFLLAPLVANANDELITMSRNPKDWVMQTGDYANQRYSRLDQITAANVGRLQVAWTFSTGVMRGHEGGPLIIGDTMYVHTPFPNIVYALDLNSDGKMLWKYEPKQDANIIPMMCCDTVNRGWRTQRARYYCIKPIPS